MKIAEIRDLATPELKERIDTEVKVYEQKKINHSISPLDSPAVITQSRKEIARMKTELRKRELDNNK
ncbi:MAG: 50S ribosomal protein L29 [Candidatus Ordinivivax streblomastigis]|uniref:Large ribosomal subunit protein uL29 n=1 Tax=Candidatus Ordinivivax streblomastigis TaxID=2540710 RepID=A0A5M8P1H6_9BACT|nr:MAG: 50S ribosomal protein L29 [Candidatus Ordinivivax streblomastigis]